MPKKCRRGAISGSPPEDVPWVWIAQDMQASPTWAALSIHARRVIDFLIAEHLSHGARENGNLAAPYSQLYERGSTKRDIKRGIMEAQICGFVRLTKQGMRVAGGGAPARYALTWLVTRRGSPDAAVATDDWRKVLVRLNRSGITSVRDVGDWVEEQLVLASHGELDHIVGPSTEI